MSEERLCTSGANRPQPRLASTRTNASLRRGPKGIPCSIDMLEHRQLLAAVVTTDQPDYAPDSIAIISTFNNTEDGANFEVGEAVRFWVHHIDERPNDTIDHKSWVVVDGSVGDLDGVADGRISTPWYIDAGSAGSTLKVKAIGLSSHAVAFTTFADTLPDTGNEPGGDTVAPTTTIQLSGTVGADNWYISAVTVTLTASDADSGVAETFYSLDGITWLTYTGAFEVSAEGVSTLQAYSVDLAANTEPSIEQSFQIDTSAATVAAVYVRGSAWSPAYLTTLAQSVGNSSATYGFAIPAGTGSTQLQTLPWRNLNQISVAFSEDVSVSQAQLLIGGSVGSYTVSGFSYNATDHVATWTLSAPIGPDRLYVALPGTGATPVTDLAGHALDGEWLNPTSYSQLEASDTFPSGNGSAGGDFAFRFNVLPGDSSGGSLGRINSSDVAQTSSRSLQPVTATNYRSDFDANNMINSSDVAYASSKSLIYALPANSPSLSPLSFSASLLLTPKNLLLA